MSTTNWTNRSVKLLTGDGDPIRAIVQRARDTTLKAMEAGWEGPPFDPIALARWLGIPVEPREDIRDARTVAQPDGKLSIEFNPNRPRGRLRYSIAHEIAHTFFPDCSDEVRNRASKEEQAGDEWQLEMLCNIAAAELLMPMGTFPNLREEAFSIDDLMALRKQYDVSTEALLLRYIRLTTQPLALFAASRHEAGEHEGRYRVDYAAASSAWTQPVQLGGVLHLDSVVAECTAIGYTAKGSERWPNGIAYQVECVGVPPYPGSTYPRVLGLLSDSDDRSAAVPQIRYLNGDALDPRGDPPYIIAHVVNDRSKSWGGGFARVVAQRLGQAQTDFRVWCNEEGNHSLGHTHFYGSDKHLVVASMVAQQGFGASASPRISYPALQACLESVSARALSSGASVHMPRIACGQAGGRWEVVSEIVDSTLCRSGVPVTVYDLP